MVLNKHVASSIEFFESNLGGVGEKGGRSFVKRHFALYPLDAAKPYGSYVGSFTL